MINNLILRSQRTKLGLTQEDVVRRVKERFGVGSQQGYAKIESGKAANSKYLAYYCDILGLNVRDVDSEMSLRQTDDADREKAVFENVFGLSDKKQIELALKILEKYHAINE